MSCKILNHLRQKSATCEPNPLAENRVLLMDLFPDAKHSEAGITQLHIRTPASHGIGPQIREPMFT